jgi:hypothetical protein
MWAGMAVTAVISRQTAPAQRAVENVLTRGGPHMRIRQTLAVILMIVVCVWIITPALAGPGGLRGDPAAPGPAAGTKGQGQSGTGESHPVIQNALKELEHTRTILVKEGAHDFEGHRTKAVQDIDQAIQELRQALQVNKQ